MEFVDYRLPPIPTHLPIPAAVEDVLMVIYVKPPLSSVPIGVNVSMAGHASSRIHPPIPMPAPVQPIDPATRVIESPGPPQVYWEESKKIQVYRRQRS